MEKKMIRILESLASIVLVVLALSVLIQILAREIFHLPATWTAELSKATYTAVVFLGAPIAVAEGKHLSVTMVKDLVKSKVVLLIFNILGDVFIYLVLITLTYGSYNRMLSEWATPVITMEWMKYGYIYAVMFAGSCCMLYSQIRCTIRYFKEFGKKEEK